MRLGLAQPAAVLAALTALVTVICVMIAPARQRRLPTLRAGLTATAASVALVAVPVPLLGAVILIAASLQASILPGRPYAERLRGPGAAALLLALGQALAAAPAGALAGKMAALCLVLSLVAAVGLVPFASRVDESAPPEGSSSAWSAAIGPALALVYAVRVLPLVPVQAGGIAGSLLLALGVVNSAWGGLGAWRSPSAARSWHHSFQAEWGLVLIALGLLLPQARAAAYLVLAGMMLTRLPLCLWSLGSGTRPPERAGTAGLVMGAALAGAAPFAGFPARLLLLRAATQVYWPFALLLAAALMLWIPHGFRLGRLAGEVTGVARAGLLLSLLLSAAAGLYPALLLSAGGFR